MYINKIVKMKNNKYKILIDSNTLITYDNVILENNLLYKKSIDKALYNKIMNDTNYYDIYNKTVKYILKRRRSENEISIYLDKFDITDNEKNDIISKLKSIKLIDDIEYSKAYINDKIYLGKDGINKIKKDLLNQNISVYVIDDILNTLDKKILNAKLENIVIKKIESNNKYSNSYLKQKLLNDMINKGYNKEDILMVIENNLTSDEEILNREFDRLYNNLSKKFIGYELENKIKQKLIQKGFRLDEINLLLNKKAENN